ncbi:myb-related protein B isoform X3 [Pleurodeles waltl]|uniref:myb-related protein B isoform X3 n=1 Tax=Pleurodeles waltl TaxID=8319 RepID=UPI003709B6F1
MARRSRSDDLDDVQFQDTDSDVPDQRENRKVKWTPEEDDRLKLLVNKFEQNEWKLIASTFPNRSDQQCQHRWTRVLNPDLVKGPWTKEEDQKVIELVKKYGTKHWTLIAKHLKGRMGKQCRERWHNHLNPEVKKSSWTEEEDQIIYDAHKCLGNRWAEIAKLLPGRTDNAVKNHWNSTIKRKVDLGFYTNKTSSESKPPSLLVKNEDIAAPLSDEKLPFTNWPTSVLEVNLAAMESDVSDASAGLTLDPATVQQTIKVEPDDEFQANEMGCEDNYKTGIVQKDEVLEEVAIKVESPDPLATTTSSVTVTGAPSPEQWVVEYVNFLGNSTAPAFTEVLDMMESDPDGWCDLSNFDLPEDSVAGNSSRSRSSSSSSEGSSPIRRTPPARPAASLPNVTEYRLDGHTISDLSKANKGELIPISPRTDLSFGTPPSLLKRQKRRKVTLSPVTENSILSSMEASNSMTPKSTPVKVLPFSPSQFLNLWTKQDALELENPSLTSTPVCSQKVIVTTPLHRDKTPLLQKNSVFITPNHRYVMENHPHTPTPFKNAMEKLGSLKPLPPTPHLEEDLKEVLRSEAGIELVIVDEAKMGNHKRKQAITEKKAVKRVDPSARRRLLGIEECVAWRWHPSCLNKRPTFLEKNNLNLQFPSQTLIRNEIRMGTANRFQWISTSLHRSPVKKVRKSLALDVVDKELKPVVLTTQMPISSQNAQCDSLLNNSLNESSCSMKEENSLLNRGFMQARSDHVSKFSYQKFLDPTPMSKEWKAVACGGTKDQLIMQQKARLILKHSHTSRTLILS